MTYSESVLASADNDGFLSDKDISRILTQHGSGWTEYANYLGGHRQTPLMAESVLAFLGY